MRLATLIAAGETANAFSNMLAGANTKADASDLGLDLEEKKEEIRVGGFDAEEPVLTPPR